MSNRYFYLSSLGSNNHSDFECTLPEQVVINPYSQVRCISCRINPSDNLMEIDDTNDLFYVGVDHWLKVNSCIPLLPVKMAKGLYDMIDGADDFLNLTAEIKEQLDKELEPYCLLRGGSDVSINDNRKLKLKLSTMSVYSCPTIALTADVANFWRNESDNQLRTTVNNTVYHPIAQYATGALPVQFDGTTYQGLALGKDQANSQFYISPPIVTGMVGATDASKHISHIIDCDFTGLKVVTDELGANHTTATDYIRFYFGDCRQDNLGTKWGTEAKVANRHSVSEPLDPSMMYALEFSNANINLRRNNMDGNGVVGTVRQFTGSGGTYSIATKFQIIVEEWETSYSSYYSVTVKRQATDADPYVDLLTFTEKKVRQRQQSSNSQNRIGVLFNTNYAGMAGMVSYTAAVDDDTHGFLSSANAYQTHATNSADIANRLLTVFSNNVAGSPNTISDRIFATMRNAIVSANLDEANDRYDRMYHLDKMPNADILSWDSNQDDGLVDSASSYTSGLQAEGGVSANNRDFPSFYLSIPSLPIQNYTGNHLQGAEQTFVCPVELTQSQTSQRLYTSKQYTEQYSSLTNSYPLNISTLKVKICDIKGVPTSQLQKYTLVVLEIRDNPKASNEELMNSLRSLVDNYNKPVKLVGDQ